LRYFANLFSTKRNAEIEFCLQGIKKVGTISGRELDLFLAHWYQINWTESKAETCCRQLSK